MDTKEIETKIVERLIVDALARGYTVSVNDGEEWVLSRSRDKAAIIAAMFSADYDTLVFHTVERNPIGKVALVYGNGIDVISDWSDNEATAELVEGANALVETLEG